MHRTYVEPFGGGASVLLRKERSLGECYNDLDGSIVNVFRVLQDPEKAAALQRRMIFTPFARAEFTRCYEPALDDVDGACKTIAMSFMGYGTDTATRKGTSGFNVKISDSGDFHSNAWAGWPDCVPDFIDRLRGVVIEQRDAKVIMARLDSEETFFFVDPPYVISTRSSKVKKGDGHGYRHEMSNADHVELAKTMHSLQGMILLAGYPSALYGELYADWHHIERSHLSYLGKKSTECLWFNAAAWERRPQRQMFAGQVGR